MTTRTRVAALAATLSLLVGVAACGETPAAKPSPGTTKSVAPLKVAPPMRLTSATFAPALNQATAKVTSFTAVGQVKVQGQTLVTTVTGTAKPFALSMTVSGAAMGGTMTAYVVKGVFYLSAPGKTPAGKYVVVDLQRDKNPQLRAVGRMLASADPTQQFKSWKAGGQKVKFIGADKLDGRAVEHYQVGLNVAKKPLVLDMWLGADKLLYKMAYSFLGMDYVTTVTSYNTVAPITAPPASKIVKQR